MSPALPVLKPKQLVKALEAGGFVQDRQRGSHLIMKHSDGRRATVPIHNKDMRPGTLKQIMRGVGWQVEELLKHI